MTILNSRDTGIIEPFNKIVKWIRRETEKQSQTHTHTLDLWSVHQWLCIFLFLVFHASSNHCKIFNEKQQQRTDIPTHLNTQIKNVNHFWITAMMTCYMCVSVYAFSAISAAAAASVCFLTSLFPCYVLTDKLTSQCTICIYIAIQNLFLLSDFWKIETTLLKMLHSKNKTHIQTLIVFSGRNRMKIVIVYKEFLNQHWPIHRCSLWMKW